MDVLSPEYRHKNMSHIKAKNTKPEKTDSFCIIQSWFSLQNL